MVTCIIFSLQVHLAPAISGSEADGELRSQASWQSLLNRLCFEANYSWQYAKRKC